MIRRLIILLNARQASVLDGRPGNMHWLGDFATTEAGLTAFQRLLMQHSGRPVRLVLDSVDEDYRLEVLPHVTGAARTEMLARKLRQVFRNAAFTGAWRQSRENEGRRDDRYLLAALTDYEWLKPWLGAIENAHAPLEGITLLSLACQSLLKQLRIREPHTLLAYQMASGLRLSYYQDGLLRFSRLLAGETQTQSPGWAADEISKTQLYLMGQRMLPREARLQVLLLDPSGRLASAQAPLNADPAFNARMLDLPTLARALRMPDEFLSSTPEIAPLAALAGETLLLDLAPPTLTQRYTEFRWRRGIHLAALAIGVAGILFTGVRWLHTLDLRDQTQQIQSEQQQLEARYRDITHSFPPSPVGAEQLGETIQLAAHLENPRQNPHHALTLVSRVLESQPAVILKKISWQDRLFATPSMADERQVSLEAELSPFDGNYRAAMQDIENFMAQLRAEPGVMLVTLSSSPVNTQSSAALSGNTLNGTDSAHARFSLELRYRETP
ncbi:MAG: monoheme cytochrome SoxX [Thiobacillaceae bacterium]